MINTINSARSLTIAILMLLSSMNVFGQKLMQLKLKIIAKEDSAAVPYVTISLIAPDGKIVTSTRGSIDGICQFAITDSLNNKLKISAVAFGFNTFLSPVISFDSNAISKTIVLEKKVNVLKEVTITTKQVEKDGSRLIYKVKQDQFSAATPISDLLPKLPGVSVVSGSVKINNREGVLILIDGKGELKDQKAQLALLASLSSDQIERIEINTIPPSKYDAGVRAIIDIITKKQKDYSNIRATVAQPFFKDNHVGTEFIYGGISSNLNFIIDKVRVTFVFGINNNRYPENNVTQESVYGVKNFTNSITSNYSGFYVTPNLNLDYDINERSSIALNADLRFVPSFHIHSIETDRFFNSGNTVLDSVAAIENTYKNDSKDLQVTGSYKYLLNKKKKSNLYVNLIYVFNPLSIVDEIDNTRATSSGDSIAILRNNYVSTTSILNASVIFSDLFKSSFLSTEFGLKSNSLTNNTTQKINADSSSFHYLEQISSLFFSTKWRFNKYLFVAEVRNELLSSDTHFSQGSTSQVLHKDYFKLYPHLLAQETVNDDLTLSIGYIKNIRRPRLNFLNPSSIITSYYNTLRGNISNNPSYFDRIEAQAMYKDLGITGYYEVVSNQIYTLPINGNPFAFQTSTLASLHSYGISMYKGLSVAKWLSVNVNTDLSHTSNPSKALGYYKNQWTSFDIGASSDFTLSKTARLQTDFYYTAKTYMAYAVYGGQFYSTITFRQLFDHNLLSLNISITDPLGLQKNNNAQYFPQLTSVWHDKTNNRILSFQMIYKFPFGQKFVNQEYKKQNNGEIRK